MQRAIYLLLFSLLLFSTCDLVDPFACDFPRGPIGPAGFTATEQGPIEEDEMVRTFQMIDADNGYAMRNARLFRTRDGGITWSGRNLDFPVANESFLFTSAAEGWMVGGGGNEGAFLMKTEDGGETFTRFDYPNIVTTFDHLIAAPDGELYATIRGFDNPNGSGIARSRDGGATFTRIFDTMGGNLDNLSVVGDRVYVIDSEGIRVIGRDGTFITTLNPTNFVTWRGELFVINDDRMLYNDEERLHQSNDGGLTWSVLHDAPAQILGGDMADEGVLLLLQTGECPQSSSIPWPVTAFTILREDLEFGPDMLEPEINAAWGTQYLGDGRWFMTDYPSDLYQVVKQ